MELDKHPLTNKWFSTVRTMIIDQTVKMEKWADNRMRRRVTWISIGTGTGRLTILIALQRYRTNTLIRRPSGCMMITPSNEENNDNRIKWRFAK